jgi:hypothetical protein
MRNLRLRVFVFLVAFLSHAAMAAFRPSFSLDYSGWHATDIVLVTTTSKDGAFQVVETWKGDLVVGEQTAVPELRPSPDAIPISNYPKSWSAALLGGVSEQTPREPIGSRMVLFLTRASGGQRTWKPSDVMDSMKASVLWIHHGDLYCFGQPSNPGPSVLSLSHYSEGELRSRVIEINGVQQDITAALAVKDATERAERLKIFVHSDIQPARTSAFEGLGKSGPSAVRTISGMLDDPAFADEASELVKALVEAGGDAVAEELNTRLQHDLAFWKSRASSLSVGWWNEDTSIHAPLRERYDQTYQLILGLEATHYSPAISTAVALRDYWRSLPQLNDPSGLNQITEECDKLIRKLQAE